MTPAPSRRKTVLVVAPSLARGGAERTVSRLSLEWAREHDVTVAVFRASNRAYPYGGKLIDLEIPVARGAFARFRMVAAKVLVLTRLLRDTRPDFVIGFMESVNIPLILAALLAPVRRVTISVRGNPVHMRWFHRLAAFCLYGLAGRVVVVSRGAAKRLIAVAPTCVRKTEVIYSPLDLDEIEAEASRRPAPEGGRFFFAAGRLVPGKAFDNMIRLFAAADCPGVRLLIAGEGPERARLESLIAERGLSERVRLLGALDNPFPHMKRALAFLMTSEHEGFPVVLIEALACGCPIVSFDCDYGPREVTQSGEAGFIVPVGDDVAFTKRLEELASNGALREKMRLSALARARDFEVRRTAEQWLRA